MRSIRIADSPDRLKSLAVEMFLSCRENALEQSGRFTVSLAGGSTPKKLYEHLASLKIDWAATYFFFGDERNVPSDDEESNFRMVNAAFFVPAGINERNIFRWRTELAEPIEIAADYAATLKTFFNDTPRFDLTLLGLGTDGHTASLFPGTDALEELTKTAVAAWVPKLAAYRLTMTLPVINNSSNIAFLVSGQEKARVLREILDDGSTTAAYPAHRVNPENGTLAWLIDKPAAEFLDVE